MEAKVKKPRKVKEKVISKDIQDIHIPLNWRTEQGDVPFNTMDNEYLAKVICTIRWKFSKYRTQQVDNQNEVERLNSLINYHSNKVSEFIGDRAKIELRDSKRASAVQTNKQLLEDATKELESRGLTIEEVFESSETVDSGNRNEDAFKQWEKGEVDVSYTEFLNKVY